MTAYLFKLNTEKTIYCKNVTGVVTDTSNLWAKYPLYMLYGSNATSRQTSQEIHYQPLAKYQEMVTLRVPPGVHDEMQFFALIRKCGRMSGKMLALFFI